MRWRGAELARLTPEVSRQVNDLLVEAGGLASLFLRTDSSPWTGAVLPDGGAVQEALELVQRLYLESLPACSESIHAITTQTGLKRPEALDGLRMLAGLLESIETTLANYAPVIYEQNLQGILHDLSPRAERRTGGGVRILYKRHVSARPSGCSQHSEGLGFIEDLGIRDNVGFERCKKLACRLRWQERPQRRRWQRQACYSAASRPSRTPGQRFRNQHRGRLEN